MFALFCLVILQAPDPIWRYQSEDLGFNVQGGALDFDSEQNFYFLNYKEATIFKVSAAGQELHKFGGKGQGPGEMQFPNSLRVRGDKVYVFDLMRRQVVIFNSDGVFQETIQADFLSTNLEPIQTGWFFKTTSSGRDEPRITSLFTASPTFTDRQELFVFEPGKGLLANEPPNISKFDMKKKSSTRGYNPATNHIFLKSIQNGRILVYSLPGPHLQIQIVDGATGELLHEIKQERKPLKFNQNWADKEFAKTEARAKEVNAKSPFKMNYVKNYPDFFPFIRNMKVYEDGSIYVLPWVSNPNQDVKLLAFDIKGNPLEKPLSPETFGPILEMNETHAWIFFHDSEEDIHNIDYVHRKDLVAYVEALGSSKSNPED